MTRSTDKSGRRKGRKNVGTEVGATTEAAATKDRRLLVRRARDSDLAALDELYRQLHPEDYEGYAVTPRAFRLAFRKVAHRRDHSLLVAERDGVVIGTLHLLIFRHLGHGLRPVAIVENVVVDQSARSQGIGEAMLKAAVKIARANGCYKLSLTSNLKRPRAHKFYKRLGWRRSHAGFTLPVKA